MKKKIVNRKRCLAPASDENYLAHCVLAESGKARDVTHDAHVAPHLREEGEPLGEIGREQESWQVRQDLQEIAARGRVQDGVDGTAGTEDLRREQPEQRSRSGEHDAALGDETGG